MRISIRFVAAAALLLISEKAIAAAPSLREVRARNFEVVSMTGERVPLADLLPEGRPVVVEFWATWCAPCRKTVPLLVELFARHEQGDISILGLNIENPVNDLDKVRKFLSDEGVSYPVAFASQELFEFMNEQDEPGVPKLLVYDTSGNLVEHILRYSPFTKRRIRKAVRRARTGE
jgi:thiol-disulfide isomerase/thioredoxin